jgi:hypothetical protein
MLVPNFPPDLKDNGDEIMASITDTGRCQLQLFGYMGL